MNNTKAIPGDRSGFFYYIHVDMLILGISAFFHDSAAAIVRDGKVLAAVQEERFTRIKNDAAFPIRAVQYCLEFAGVSLDDLDGLVFYDKPLLKLERILESYHSEAPAGLVSFLKSMPVWMKQKMMLKKIIREALYEFQPFDRKRLKLLFCDHHLSHAASAFYVSPYEQAAILTIDGVGEWATTTIGMGDGKTIRLLKEIRFPHSLGLLYSAFTYYCGFSVNSGEYKLMGLAPYGEPKYVDLILEKLVDLKSDGSFRMDMSYFNYCQGLTMTNEKFNRLFGGPVRKTDSHIDERF